MLADIYQWLAFHGWLSIPRLLLALRYIIRYIKGCFWWTVALIQIYVVNTGVGTGLEISSKSSDTVRTSGLQRFTRKAIP